MLDYSKLFKEIEKFSDDIFYDHSSELLMAQNIWNKISTQQDFNQKIKNSAIPLLIPSWEGILSRTEAIKPLTQYCIISCDGSQIYPDRHQGTSCFLINIGTVEIEYNESSKALFNSFPFLFSQKDDDSIDIVDCKRQEYEFQFGLDLMKEQKKKNQNIPQIFLFDGSLIFWHLESMSPNISQEYIGKYLGLLHQFYKENLLIAGYISLPKSKELINLIRAELLLTKIEDKIDNILDIHIADFYLKDFHRTILFKNHSPITKQYPTHLHPHFFYLNNGQEIVRIEIPQWIAQDSGKVDIIARIILDQCIKVQGYPICLAEAHEQAVVKSQDREYFYGLLHKMNVKHKHKFFMSQKSIKKKFMPI